MEERERWKKGEMGGEGRGVERGERGVGGVGIRKEEGVRRRAERQRWREEGRKWREE